MQNSPSYAGSVKKRFVISSFIGKLGVFKTLLDMKRGFVLFSDFSSLMGVAVMPEQFLKAVKAVRLRVSGVRLVLSVFELLIGDGIGDNDDKNDERSMECGVWIIIIAENWQKKIIYFDVHSSAANWSSGQIFITSIQISLIIFLFFHYRLSKTYSLNLSLKNTQGLYVFEGFKRKNKKMIRLI